MSEDKKPFYKSKTLIVNLLVIGGALLTQLADLLGTGGTISLIAMVNILLRVVTKSELKLL